MLIIGIDPGISGSLCFFNDGKIIDLVEMPSMAEGKKNKKQVNSAQIYNEIYLRIKDIEKKDIKVVIEQVLQCRVKELLACLILVNPLEF